MDALSLLFEWKMRNNSDLSPKTLIFHTFDGISWNKMYIHDPQHLPDVSSSQSDWKGREMHLKRRFWWYFPKKAGIHPKRELPSMSCCSCCTPTTHSITFLFVDSSSTNTILRCLIENSQFYFWWTHDTTFGPIWLWNHPIWRGRRGDKHPR